MYMKKKISNHKILYYNYRKTVIYLFVDHYVGNDSSLSFFLSPI